MAAHDRDDATADHMAEEHFAVELAGLSTTEQQQVMDAMRDAEFDGTLPDIDINELTAEAVNAEAARETAEDLRQEQAEAAEAGDYEAAHEAARKGDEQLDAAAGHGAKVDTAARENQHDVQVLDEAQWQQDIAEAGAESAEASADDGDLDAAEDQADDADDHDDTADDHADDADHGGRHGDHSVDTDD